MPTKWYADPDFLARAASRGLEAGAVHVVNVLKDVLSVPAPRRRVLSKRGSFYYVATEPAIKGAPPRKLSGHLRRNQAYEMRNGGWTARVGTNVVYGRRHEHGDHPYMLKTIKREAGRLAKIIGSKFRLGA